MTDEVERAMATLRFKGCDVWRMDFPAPPFPGLYRVNGREMTEAQLVQVAETMPESRLETDGVVIVGLDKRGMS